MTILATIEAVPKPDHAGRATAAAENTNLIHTTGVLTSRITGVNWTIRNVLSGKERESDNDVNPKEEKGDANNEAHTTNVEGILEDEE